MKLDNERVVYLVQFLGENWGEKNYAIFGEILGQILVLEADFGV